MNKLDQMLENKDVNLYHLFRDDVKDLAKTERVLLVKSATRAQLEQIIIKFNDHDLFLFLEDLICDGGVNVMSEGEYWDFLESQGL